MPKDYVVTLSDVEVRALRYVSVSANDWIQNAIHERCRLAIEEMVQTDIQTKLANGETISGTKEEMVLASTLPSAQERHDASMAQIASAMVSPPA